MRERTIGVLGLFFLGVCIAAIMGCRSGGDVISQKTLYVLDAMRPGAEATGNGPGVLKVRRFSISTRFEGYELVYRTGELTYESDFYNKFFAPPGVIITEETRDWLSDSGIFGNVLDMLSSADYDYVLEGDVQALYGDFSKKKEHSAVVAIRFVVVDVRGPEERPVFDETYRVTEALESDKAEDLVARLNKCLVQILGALESDLRQLPSRVDVKK